MGNIGILKITAVAQSVIEKALIDNFLVQGEILTQEEIQYDKSELSKFTKYTMTHPDFTALDNTEYLFILSKAENGKVFIYALEAQSKDVCDIVRRYENPYANKD